MPVWVAALQKEEALSEVHEGDPATEGWINSSFCPKRGRGGIACGFELCHIHLAALHSGRHRLENNILQVLNVLVGNSYFSAGEREGKDYLKKVQSCSSFHDVMKDVCCCEIPELIFQNPSVFLVLKDLKPLGNKMESFKIVLKIRRLQNSMLKNANSIQLFSFLFSFSRFSTNDLYFHLLVHWRNEMEIKFKHENEMICWNLWYRFSRNNRWNYNLKRSSWRVSVYLLIYLFPVAISKSEIPK